MHICLVTRHYPPEPSGGARRPYLFTQALRRAGHRVTVVSPFIDTDEPDAIVVPHPVQLMPAHERTPDLGERNSRLRNFLRQWLLWPDAEIRWAKRVESCLLDTAIRPDWILTTSPPESLHMIGPRLKYKMKCRWVAEFRDTWVEHSHRKILRQSRIRRASERLMAKRTLRHADAITAVSTAVMGELQHYCRPNTPSSVIDHFSNFSESRAELSKDELHLVHSGGFTLSDSRRQLPDLLRVLSKSCSARPDATFHFHIAGPLSTSEAQYAQSLEHSVPNLRMTHHGVVSLERSRELQAAADALILHTPVESHALPGKFAEYRQTRLPIFYLGGGSWRGLLDHPEVMQPLDVGIRDLQKGDRISEDIPLGFSDEEAAAALIALLETAETHRIKVLHK